MNWERIYMTNKTYFLSGSPRLSSRTDLSQTTHIEQAVATCFPVMILQLPRKRHPLALGTRWREEKRWGKNFTPAVGPTLRLQSAPWNSLSNRSSSGDLSSLERKLQRVPTYLGTFRLFGHNVSGFTPKSTVDMPRIPSIACRPITTFSKRACHSL
jgi:hypothetical protein